MRLLITGTSGFIGSHLLKAAIEEFGADSVVALSSRTSDQCDSVVYDRHDYSVKAGDLVKIEHTDVLIHAGAFTPKSGAEANSVEGCNSNIAFTAELLEQPFARLKKILYLSTLDVYAPAEHITESTPTIPSTLYGLSKLYCENMVRHFSPGAGIASQVLRIGHVYGPGEENYAKFLPSAIGRIVAGQAVELWGDGSELRSFIFVDDVVRAILKAVCKSEETETVNVVGGTAISIRQVLDHLIAISGKEVEIVTRETDRPGRDIVFDNTLCRTRLLPEETDLLAGLRAEYEHVEKLQHPSATI